MSEIVKVRKFNQAGIVAVKELLSKIRNDNELHAEDAKSHLSTSPKIRFVHTMRHYI